MAFPIILFSLVFKASGIMVIYSYPVLIALHTNSNWYDSLGAVWPSREVARFHFGPCEVRKGHLYVLYVLYVLYIPFPLSPSPCMRDLQDLNYFSCTLPLFLHSHTTVFPRA